MDFAKIIMNISTPSTGKIIAFAGAVLVVALGVAYAPEIKGLIRRVTKRG